jgi:hypothetical protein
VTAEGRAANPDPLVNPLGSLDGADIPGGCDECEAYQTAHVEAPGVWIVEVHHGADCPAWLEMQSKQEQL